MMKSEICVPESALAIASGEGGGSVAPGVGEEVTLDQVKGTVSRAEGGNVYITVSEANGQPVAADPMGDHEGDMEGAEAALGASLSAGREEGNYV